MSLHTIRRICETALMGASLLFLSLPCRAQAGQNGSHNGSFVYVMTNQASGNTILVFERNAAGSLSKVQEVSTDGQGSGGSADPLGSQGALTLDDSGRLLLAVDAGSNEISSLSVTKTGLQFLSKAPSGGTKPVSVAVHGDTVYVLNAAGTPNVTVFRLGPGGELTMIANSTQPLPGGANAAPAQVGITPDGEILIVTEKNTNLIDLFSVNTDGTVAAPTSTSSDGATPFGFTFGQDRILIVSEAAASSFSSYAVHNTPNGPLLQPITKSLTDGGAAACWIVTKGGRRLAFAANSASDTISSLAVSPHGNLQLLVPVAASTASGTIPIDMALTRNGEFLYVVGTGNGTLTGFRVQHGKLAQVASVAGLPPSVQGIAAH